MVLGGPLNIALSNLAASPGDAVLDDMIVAPAIAGERATFLLAGDGLASTSFTVDVPSDAPITSIHLAMEPAVQPTQNGFVWDDAGAWSANSAVHNGTYGADDVLTGDGGGTLWDFNSGLQGWTVSTASYVGRSTLNCGYNGSTGGSIKTQANYNAPEYATSPAVNLAGMSTIPKFSRATGIAAAGPLHVPASASYM